MRNLLKRFKRWLYRVEIDTRYNHKGIYIAGGLINSASDLKSNNDENTYWDFQVTQYLTVIHGRGYGYSIWIGLVLVTLYRAGEPSNKRIDIAWNHD